MTKAKSVPVLRLVSLRPVADSSARSGSSYCHSLGSKRPTTTPGHWMSIDVKLVKSLRLRKDEHDGVGAHICTLRSLKAGAFSPSAPLDSILLCTNFFVHTP